jgi:hypothetical protein
LAIKHFNYEIPGTIFIHRIIPYYPKDYVIGILIYRTKIYLKPESGFILSSPSQLIGENKRKTLFAMYPPDPNMIMPHKNLNYGP